ncbi:MAG: aldo/keto reductase [Pseudomonadota bacterium]|nr:aldo/keto reductase [Pseudomonadota bacterium]
MQYVLLPRADVSVSRIAIGCEQLGGTDWGRYDRQETIRAVAHSADLGINVFDTADVYGLGESERALAMALGARRREMFIVTKGGVRWELRPGQTRARTSFDLSPEYLRRSVEDSLRRLSIDSIPLYLLHAPDRSVPLEQSLEAMMALKNAGKVRAIGLSKFAFADIRRADALADIAAIELRYNLLERAPETEIFPWCRERGIGIFAYGPLAEGLLAGKYSEASRFDSSDRRSRLPHFQGDALRTNLNVVERVRRAAADHSRSAAQIAVNWVLSRDAVTAAVVGVKNAKQLEEVAGSVGWEIEPRVFDD